MCAKVMVLTSKISFKTTPNQEQIDDFPSQTLFMPEDDNIVIDNYKWFEEDVLMSDIETLYSYCDDNKIKIKGNILFVKKEDDDEDADVDVSQHCIKFGSKEVTDTECSFSITCRKQGERKKPLTLDEKIALYEEYWQTKHEVPPPKEIYKGFRIGSFYSTCKKNGDVMQTLNDIEKESGSKPKPKGKK